MGAADTDLRLLASLQALVFQLRSTTASQQPAFAPAATPTRPSSSFPLEGCAGVSQAVPIASKERSGDDTQGC